MFESTVVCGRIALGIQGEHNARKVAFYDAKIWQEIFGEGRFELLHQRNGDEAPYPVVVTIEDDVPYWYVSSSDTAVAGSGKCELRYMVDDKLIKSCTYITDVVASLGDGTEEPPEPYKAWVDEVLEAGERAKEAVDSVDDAIQAAERAEQYAKDAEAFASESNGHIANESNPHKVTASQVGAYTKEEVDKKLSEIGGSIDAYTKAEIDEKLKNPSYEEDVSLVGITTATPMHDGASIIINDNSVSSDGCVYDINVQGNVSLTCECTFGWSEIIIDGKTVASLGDTGVFTYSFEGEVKSGITVRCSMTSVTFTKFVKKIYVADAIGDIDSALDAILAIQESIIGGAEQ